MQVQEQKIYHLFGREDAVIGSRHIELRLNCAKDFPVEVRVYGKDVPATYDPPAQLAMSWEEMAWLKDRLGELHDGMNNLRAGNPSVPDYPVSGGIKPVGPQPVTDVAVVDEVEAKPVKGKSDKADKSDK